MTNTYSLRIVDTDGKTIMFQRHMSSPEIAAFLNLVPSLGLTLDDDEIDYNFNNDFPANHPNGRWISYCDDSGEAIVTEEKNAI